MRWIVTDNIYAETWRNILEFANVDLTLDAIQRRHGAAQSSGQRANYLKQAQQARVCALQAKEYFDAARSSSLFTSPNHAYYGAVSLASLCMLLLGDGTKSLDYLRADNRNNHHGLDLKLGCSSRTATSGVTLLQQTSAEVLKHGHFSNWYRTLPQKGTVYGFVRQQHEQTASSSYVPVGGYDIPAHDSLVGKATSLLDLIRYLPDLDVDLARSGISTARSRSRHETHLSSDGTNNQTWLLHGCRTPDELEQLLERFSISSSYADSLTVTIESVNNAAIVKLAVKMPAVLGLTWPTCRETLSHDTVSYADMRDVHEVVDLYLIAYQLSMLSRYYPDIWISCLESRCRGAKLIEQCLDLLVKKLPILMLSMACSEDVVITTHREPWKS